MPVQDVSVHAGEPAAREHDSVPTPRPPVLSRARDRNLPTVREEIDEEPTEEAGYGYGV